MKELSLHILDIVQNSIKAKATEISLEITEDTVRDSMVIAVRDNGCGMSAEFVSRVRDPFTTTRTTRKAGLGIPLWEAAAVATGGRLDIESEVGVGTVVTAHFSHSHIDRAPLGDMASTMVTILSGSPDIEFLYEHCYNGKTFSLSTRELREVLGGVPLDTPDVLTWVKGYVEEGLAEIINS